jgi:hypothetical protein
VGDKASKIPADNAVPCVAVLLVKLRVVCKLLSTVRGEVARGVTNLLLDVLGNVLLDVVCEDGCLGYSTVLY